MIFLLFSFVCMKIKKNKINNRWTLWIVNVKQEKLHTELSLFDSNWSQACHLVPGCRKNITHKGLVIPAFKTKLNNFSEISMISRFSHRGEVQLWHANLYYLPTVGCADLWGNWESESPKWRKLMLCCSIIFYLNSSDSSKCPTAEPWIEVTYETRVELTVQNNLRALDVIYCPVWPGLY